MRRNLVVIELRAARARAADAGADRTRLGAGFSARSGRNCVPLPLFAQPREIRRSKLVWRFRRVRSPHLRRRQGPREACNDRNEMAARAKRRRRSGLGDINWAGGPRN